MAEFIVFGGVFWVWINIISYEKSYFDLCVFQRVMEHFIKLYKKKKGKDLRKDNRAVQKLRREVEKAKRALSTAHQVRYCLHFYKTCFTL